MSVGFKNIEKEAFASIRDIEGIYNFQWPTLQNITLEGILL